MNIKIKIKSKSDSEISERRLRDKRANNIRRSNCRIERDELEREVKSVGSGKEKKEQPIERRTKVQVCDVERINNESSEEKSNRICVDRSSFQNILDKVDAILSLQNTSEELSEESESRRERLTRVFGKPWNDLIKLSKGIVEAEKKKKEPKYKGCHGNPRHRANNTSGGKAGTFMSDSDLKSGNKGSASFWYSCRDKLGRVGLKGKKHRWIKDPDKCGRSSNDTPRKKCSDFSENLISEDTKNRWSELIKS
jgi:hypothetical protein